jgi:hypothetical protein
LNPGSKGRPRAERNPPLKTPVIHQHSDTHRENARESSCADDSFASCQRIPAERGTGASPRTDSTPYSTRQVEAGQLRGIGGGETQQGASTQISQHADSQSNAQADAGGFSTSPHPHGCYTGRLAGRQGRHSPLAETAAVKQQQQPGPRLSFTWRGFDQPWLLCCIPQRQ